MGGQAMMERSRTTDIMADAAWAILTRNSKQCTGNFFIDQQVEFNSSEIFEKESLR